MKGGFKKYIAKSNKYVSHPSCFLFFGIYPECFI